MALECLVYSIILFLKHGTPIEFENIPVETPENLLTLAKFLISSYSNYLFNYLF